MTFAPEEDRRLLGSPLRPLHYLQGLVLARLGGELPPRGPGMVDIQTGCGVSASTGATARVATTTHSRRIRALFVTYSVLEMSLLGICV